jgi:hypothetical protein
MRALLIGLAVLGIATATMATAATDVNTFRLGPGLTFVGEDANGNLIVKQLSASPDDTSGCAAPAPCVNGPHVRLSGITHGFLLGPLATGSYTSALVGLPSATPSLRVFTCGFANGAGSCAPGQGTFPAVGQSFDQVCAFGAVDGACYLTV